MFFYKNILYIIHNKKNIVQYVIFIAILFALNLEATNIYLWSLGFIFLEVDMHLIKSDKKYGVLKRVSTIYSNVRIHTTRVLSLYVVHLIIHIILGGIIVFSGRLAFEFKMIFCFLLFELIYSVVSYVVIYWIENEIIAITILMIMLYAAYIGIFQGMGLT
ncbi:MAG: hypothetical protein COA82_09150 [Alkaliphilus sp.]|nr:MAG: hypothetical protein COA82_09150 [Alkaliphilus sp.]